jgi:hypothetical protein
VIDTDFRAIEQKPATDPRHDKAPGKGQMAHFTRQNVRIAITIRMYTYCAG